MKQKPSSRRRRNITNLTENAGGEARLSSCESKNLFQPVPRSSFFAQQYRRIDRQRPLRRNPRGQ